MGVLENSGDVGQNKLEIVCLRGGIGGSGRYACGCGVAEFLGLFPTLKDFGCSAFGLS